MNDGSGGRTRRNMLGGAGAAVAGSLLLNAPVAVARADPSPAAAPSTRPLAAGRTAGEPFGYCLNTSTIRGANLGLVQVLEIASSVGYAAVEPWLGEIEAYEKKGGSLGDLRKRLVDLNLTVESAIGFANWIVDDDAQRAKGLEQMRRDMDKVAQIGGLRIAAPPAGAQAADGPKIDLFRAAERYRAILELGDQTGVVPEAEVWGFASNMRTLGEVAMIAVAAGHPKACILPDVYHLHKGGSDHRGLALIAGGAIPVIHFNDYPADPPRETIVDAQRVYPGDGVAPLDAILRTLQSTGFRGFLSLELFNKEYWKLSPKTVAQTGIDKLRASVRKAGLG